MSNMDPVSDLLTRIRNAHLAKHDRVDVPTSSLKTEICRILRDEGFIRNYKIIEDSKQGMLAITLKYTEANQSVIAGARRVSKPGCRVYCSHTSVPKVLDGLGTAIVSTSRGLMTGRKCEEQTVEATSVHASQEAEPRLFILDKDGKLHIYDGHQLKLQRTIEKPGTRGLLQAVASHD